MARTVIEVYIKSSHMKLQTVPIMFAEISLNMLGSLTARLDGVTEINEWKRSSRAMVSIKRKIW